MQTLLKSLLKGTSSVMIKENLKIVLDKIDKAARRAGRSPASIKVMGVTKTKPVEVVKEAIEAGIKLIGENYVQEAIEKKEVIGDMADAVEWHMIGHLQRNKAKKAVSLFDCIQTVDNLRLAETLSKHAQNSGKEISLLIQVNIAKEPQKSGIDPEKVPDLIEQIIPLPSVAIKGLMVIPPYSPDPEQTRVWFKQTRQLRDDLANQYQGKAIFNELSMGMSGDFEVAIEEGATIVRLGTILFGPRRR